MNITEDDVKFLCELLYMVTDSGKEVNRLRGIIKKLNEWVASDKVVVTDNGQTYNCYDVWVERHAPDYIGFFKHDIPDNNQIYTVVAKGKHDEEDEMLYLIKGSNNHVYLIGETGIELCK